MEDAPDLVRFPRFAAATRTQLTVGPGDCFFIPQLWWHNIRSPPGELTLSFNLWFGMPNGDRGHFDFERAAMSETEPRSRPDPKHPSVRRCPSLRAALGVA